MDGITTRYTGMAQDGSYQQPTLLNPDSLRKFVNALPTPEVIDANRSGTYVLQMRQTDQWLGLTDSSGNPLMTTVWGVGQPGGNATYPGPTIIAHEGTPIKVNWQNKLPVNGHLLPVDTSITIAEPSRKTLDEGYVPTVMHLHGGHTESASDGLPEAWFTQNDSERGPMFEKRIYDYANDQQAATLWYHDHTMGLTRLNVYAGLAGFYLLRDANEDKLVKDGVLPGGTYETGVAIQDRSFTSDGQLYYPAYPNDPIPGSNMTVGQEMAEGGATPDYPTVRPEFFGDVILANGMAWPKADVDPGQYRYRLLNGSDSRFYVLRFSDPDVKATLVGTDGGLLPNAVTVMDGDGTQETSEQIVLAPGDRVDLVLDFSEVAGQTVTLENVGPVFDPFAGLDEDGSLAEGMDAADPDTDPVGQIMRFNVADKAPIQNASVYDGQALNPDAEPLDTDSAKVRKLGLFEGADAKGRVEPQLGVAETVTDIDGNTVPFGPLDFDAPITETPTLGSTEVWEIYNFTADAHPIHLHQVQFQVLDKQRFDITDENDDDMPDDGQDDIFLLGDADDVTLRPEDLGWQDTAWVAPGEVIRVAATFDLPGDYVWHCHILSHEDHEMMRPFRVVDDLFAT